MNLSFKQYRAIDLGIMLFMLAVAEVVITKAATVWFPYESYVLSPTIAIVCIVMMRWGWFAAVHAVGGGLALCIASGADPNQFAVYCIGNCFALMALVLFKVFGRSGKHGVKEGEGVEESEDGNAGRDSKGWKAGKEKIRSTPSLTVLFVAVAFFGAQAGRWLVGLLMGGSAGDLITFLTTDSLSLMFALLAVLIARRIDGLFEDQLAYLVRTQAERNRQQMQQQMPDYGDTEYGEGSDLYK